MRLELNKQKSISFPNQLESFFYDIYLDNQEEVGYCYYIVGGEEYPLLGNIGYFIHEEYRHHRYGLQATGLLLNELHRQGISSVNISIEEDNASSIRIVEGLNAKLKEIVEVEEGVKRRIYQVSTDVKPKGIIRTVLGNIDSRLLGFCHSHEHVYIPNTLPKDCPIPPIDDYALTLKELKDFYEVGGNALVDCQPISAGGNLEELRKLSKESKVHIIGMSGFHRAMYYEDRSQDTLEGLIAQYTKELEEGAGCIKAAVESCGINEKDEMYHHAVALTSLETGFPILVHVENETDLNAFVHYYTSLGVNPNRIILCHCDRKIHPIENTFGVLDQGVYLEFDSYMRYKYHDDDYEMSVIQSCLDHGYENQILLGLDSTPERLESYGGNVGLVQIKKTMIPKMLEKGISEEKIHKMMVENPSNAFQRR